MEKPGRYFFVEVVKTGAEDAFRYTATVVKRHVNHQGVCSDIRLNTTSSSGFNDSVKSVKAFKGKYRLRCVRGVGLDSVEAVKLGCENA